MKILVTGSAGNVGRPVCRELSRRGHEVRGLDRVPTPGLRDAIVADIADEAPVRDAVRGVQAVVFGATGTGKSALLSLILRFYDPGRGRVLVDGIDVRQLDLSSPPGPASCATWSAGRAPRWSRALSRRGPSSAARQSVAHRLNVGRA
jgi:NAD(P)-dependent dehydrogenase (short-subunit alcohol dehydrogenase family)